MAEKAPALRDLAAKYLQRAEPVKLAQERLLVVDWSKIFALFPRYCHILLIAPHHASPDYTDYSIQGADDFFAFANPIATVKYLRDNMATRANVEKELRDFNPRLVSITTTAVPMRCTGRAPSMHRRQSSIPPMRLSLTCE